MKSNHFIKFFTALGLIFITAGCPPRGENKSVDEVLNIQSSRFVSARSSAKVDAPVGDVLGKVEAKLSELVKGEGQKASGASIDEMAALLDQLLLHAAYTTRPALTEIAKQYRALSVSETNPSQLKLLAARTYSVLSAELETTKFSVS